MRKFHENFNFSYFWSIFWLVVCLVVAFYFWDSLRIIAYLFLGFVALYIYYMVRNFIWRTNVIEDSLEVIDDEEIKSDNKLLNDFNDFLMNPKLIKSRKINFALDVPNTTDQWISKEIFKRTKLYLYVEKNVNEKYVGYFAKKNRKGELIYHLRTGQCNDKDSVLFSLQKKI